MKLKNFKIKFFARRRGPRGQGRTVKYKQLLLPEDIIEELKMYKEEYCLQYSKKQDANGDLIPAKITYEQLFRSWLDELIVLDPVIYARVQKRMKEKCQINNWTYRDNPFNYPLSKHEYYFLIDNKYYDLRFRDGRWYCVAPRTKYDKFGIDQMYDEGFFLISDIGVTFTRDEAHELVHRLQVVDYGMIQHIDRYMTRKGITSMNMNATIAAFQECLDKSYTDLYKLIETGILGDSATNRFGIWTIRKSVFDWTKYDKKKNPFV